MREIKGINISKSIKSGKLYYKKDWTDKLDDAFTYLIYFFGIFIAIEIFFKKKLSYNTFLNYILFTIILILLYGIYRKIIENKLLEINTKFNDEINRNILLSYFKNKPHKIVKNSKQLLILNETEFGFSHTRKTIILFKDNKIFFTILKIGYKIDPPVLFSHIFLKNKMEKYFEETTI